MRGGCTIGLVGAGAIGTSVAGHLLAADRDARLSVFDLKGEALQVIARLDPERVDVRQGRVTAADLELCDLVVNTAGPFFAATTAVAEAAIAAGCRYVDVCDDPEGLAAIEALDQSAIAHRVPLLTGAGVSPGISNILARRLVELYPGVDGIVITWVVREEDPGGLAALRHFLHMAVAPAPRLVGGERSDSAGFRPETASVVDFGDPIGSAEVFHTPHPEPITLARMLPQLRDITCQGGLLPSWANGSFSTIARLGFASVDSVSTPLGDVDPVEVLWGVLWDRHRATAHERSGLAGLHVAATSAGAPVATMVAIDDAAMGRATGIGAAAIARCALSEDLPPGVHSPEVLDAARALAEVRSVSERAGAFRSGFRVIEHA